MPIAAKFLCDNSRKYKHIKVLFSRSLTVEMIYSKMQHKLSVINYNFQIKKS